MFQQHDDQQARQRDTQRERLYACDYASGRRASYVDDARAQRGAALLLRSRAVARVTSATRIRKTAPRSDMLRVGMPVLFDDEARNTAALPRGLLRANMRSRGIRSAARKMRAKSARAQIMTYYSYRYACLCVYAASTQRRARATLLVYRYAIIYAAERRRHYAK